MMVPPDDRQVQPEKKKKVKLDLLNSALSAYTHFFWVAELSIIFSTLSLTIFKSFGLSILLLSFFSFWKQQHNRKMASTEELQTLVLTTLDKENVIQDSKTLTFNDKPVDQLALLGALNSLKSKDVNIFLFCSDKQ